MQVAGYRQKRVTAACLCYRVSANTTLLHFVVDFRIPSRYIQFATRRSFLKANFSVETSRSEFFIGDGRSYVDILQGV